MVAIGDSAPAFSCRALTKLGAKDITLKDFSGKWKVLLFYVADFSPVCPTEVVELNKEYERFSSEGIELIGISSDSLDTHKKLVKEMLGGALKFPLLSDSDGAVGKAYTVFSTEKKNEMRATVIIDPNDKISYFCVSENRLGRSTKELYRASMGLKSGDACIVNWEPKN